jgi:hypothetical protein
MRVAASAVSRRGVSGTLMGARGCLEGSWARLHRRDVELGLVEQGQLNLPAEGGDADVFDDHLGSDLPLLTQRAGIRECQHVVAG